MLDFGYIKACMYTCMYIYIYTYRYIYLHLSIRLGVQNLGRYPQGYKGAVGSLLGI